MTKDELRTILAKHAAWCADQTKGKRADLGGADLGGADLRGAYLRGADLRSANLGDADLRSANLGNADLRDANLGGADLRSANLEGADLRDADLRGADLRDAGLADADLRGANLGGADLGGADLRGADLVIALGQPNGWWAFAYLWESEIWVRVGCRTFSIADGRKYWHGKKERREVLAALDYAETIAKLRGWEIKK